MKTQFLVWLKNQFKDSKNGIIYSIIFILIAVGSFIGGRYSTLKIRNALKYNIIAQRDSIRSYEIEIKGLRTLVFEKDALILSKQDAIDAGLLENSLLKKLHLQSLVATAKLEGIIKVLRDSLALQPDIVFITVKDSTGVKDYLKVPFTLIDINEKDLFLKAGMRENRKIYFDLKIPLSGQMHIGYVRDGFLKSKPVGIFTTTNRNVQINNAEVIVISDPKKLYQQWWTHSIAGIVLFEGLRILYKNVK